MVLAPISVGQELDTLWAVPCRNWGHVVVGLARIEIQWPVNCRIGDPVESRMQGLGPRGGGIAFRK